jgi:hypothetical protein
MGFLGGFFWVGFLLPTLPAAPSASSCRRCGREPEMGKKMQESCHNDIFRFKKIKKVGKKICLLE